MIRLALASTALALSLAARAPAQPAPEPPAAVATTDPMDFAAKATQSNEFERREGRLALQHARHSEVKAFAAEMVHDHTQSTQDLQEALRRAGMTPPPPSLSPDQERMLADLQANTGPGFDHMYADQQVIAHKQAEALMQAFSQGGPPGPLRDAAAHTLPMVQHHLGEAMKLAQQLATT